MWIRVRDGLDRVVWRSTIHGVALMPLRIVSGIVGVFFLAQGLGWIVSPANAAQALGMPFLTGAARSTQLGDIGGFFIALGTMCLLGAWRSNAQWLRGGALMLGCVAVMRTLAWMIHDAELTIAFIAVEVVLATLLVFLASRIEATKGIDLSG